MYPTNERVAGLPLSTLAEHLRCGKWSFGGSLFESSPGSHFSRVPKNWVLSRSCHTVNSTRSARSATVFTQVSNGEGTCPRGSKRGAPMGAGRSEHDARYFGSVRKVTTNIGQMPSPQRGASARPQGADPRPDEFYGVWTANDFLDMGSGAAVDKILQRLATSNTIRRIDIQKAMHDRKSGKPQSGVEGSLRLWS